MGKLLSATVDNLKIKLIRVRRIIIFWSVQYPSGIKRESKDCFHKRRHSFLISSSYSFTFVINGFKAFALSLAADEILLAEFLTN